VTATFLQTHFACELFFQTKPKIMFHCGAFPLPLIGSFLAGSVLPLHHQRHCPHVSFTTVLRMDVLQHCVSGQRSWVSEISLKVSNVLRVRAGNTDERRTSLVSADMIHSSYSLHDDLEYYCDQSHRCAHL
jgi:hypothetical protein